MLVLVTTIDTKEKIPKETAYYAPNKKYYSSKSAYRKWKNAKAQAKHRKEEKREQKQLIREKKRKLSEQENLARKECVQWMFDMMDYQTTDPMPEVFFKKMKSWKISHEIILETMHLVEDKIRSIISNREFDDDFAKACYICAVVGNHLIDGMKRFSERQKTIKEAQKKEVSAEDFPSEEELLNIGVKNADRDVKKVQDVLTDIVRKEVFDD